MTTKVIAFFNNKGGVGKTSLVYHLAWMYSDLELRIVAADLDPQANLTSAFLNEDQLIRIWPDGDHPDTVYGCVQPLIKGVGDIADPYLELVGQDQGFDFNRRIALLSGDLLLSSFEDQLSETWPKCLMGDERAFRVTSAFWRIMQRAADQHEADLILVDLGPNLGAINRTVLIAADYVVVPLSPDLFSLQGLRNLGPTLIKWREDWKDRLKRKPISDLILPEGNMQPVGYVVLQHAVRMDRPVVAYERWIKRIPEIYQRYVLNNPNPPNSSINDDPNQLTLLKHYHSLMAMAQESHKPIFYLKPADGAMGAQVNVVKNAYQDFERLALKIAEKTSIALPQIPQFAHSA